MGQSVLKPQHGLEPECPAPCGNKPWMACSQCTAIYFMLICVSLKR